MDQRTREIRTILMGFINYREQFVVAAEDVLQSNFRGLYNGASAARFYGLKEVRKQYKLSTGKVYGNEPIARSMLAMGQMVYLFSADDTSAVLYRPLLLNPVMITAEADKRDALFCFYTAKTPLAGLTIRHTMKKLEAGFPEDFKETPVTMTPSVLEPPEPPKPKREKHADKKRKDAGEAPDGENADAESPEGQTAAKTETEQAGEQPAPAAETPVGGDEVKNTEEQQ